MVGDAHELIERRWAQGVLRDARDAGIEHLPQTDVLERLRAWDAFVLPSRADPFPISMLEAMAQRAARGRHPSRRNRRADRSRDRAC